MWKVEVFDESNSEAWDELVFNSADGCLLQSRQFLSYHGERFRDKSVLVYSPSGELVAVLPCAEVSQFELASHPGSTFGGVVSREPLSVDNSVKVMSAIADHYRNLGYESMTYTAIPTTLHRFPNESDLYAIWLNGAALLRRQPTFILDPNQAELGRKKNRKIAHKNDLLTEITSDSVEVFTLIEKELLSRHGVPPVHSMAEIQQLELQLGPRFFSVGTYLGDELVAGSVVFDLGTALHTQYLGNTENGRTVQALDATVEFLYNLCKAQGKKLSFGISSDQSGLNVNWGLAKFKENFGASLHTIDRYKWHFVGSHEEADRRP